MLVERNIAMRAGKSLLDKPCYIEWNPFKVGAMKLFAAFIVQFQIVEQLRRSTFLRMDQIKDVVCIGSDLDRDFERKQFP